MNVKFVIGFLVVSLAFALSVAVVQFFSMPKNAAGVEILKLKSFVDNATMLVGEKGETAFVNFKDKNGGWINDDSYLFVYDMKGNTIVLPPQPELEGTNRMATQDPEGKYFVKEMVNILKVENSGWFDYKYMKPGKTENSTKLSYFRKVQIGDKEYFVGSGIYLD